MIEKKLIMTNHLIEEISISNVCEHYDIRLNTSCRLRQLLQQGATTEYCRLALGMSDKSGNYSASEHKLGPRILPRSTDAVFRLANKLRQTTTADEMLSTVYAARIQYLKIGVGSEMAMMLKPDKFWVANVRSVWTHLLVKHNYSLSMANDELSLYRDQDRSSEMDYRIWKDIYKDIRTNLIEVGLQVSIKAKKAPPVEDSIYLWCDAVASELYAQEHE